MTASLSFEKLAPLGAVPHTGVTYMTHVNLGGYIQHKLVNGKTVGVLLHLSDTRKVFDKSADIDAATRASYLPMFEHGAGGYWSDDKIVF